MPQSKSSHYFMTIVLSYFYSNTNQCFPSSTPTSFPGFWTAHICFIYLYYSTQSIPIGPNHSTTQFMQPLPRRTIASQTQKALQSKSISAIFLICYMPHRTKPHWQRLASSVQNGSRSHRSLCAAFRAMEQTSAGFPYFPRLAMRANKATRPSQLSEVLQAGRLGAKPFFKFHQCSWVIFLHRKGILHLVATGVKCIPTNPYLLFGLFHCPLFRQEVCQCMNLLASSETISNWHRFESNSITTEPDRRNLLSGSTTIFTIFFSPVPHA